MGCSEWKYLIVSCSHCGGLQVARAGAKSKTCPYCGRRFSLLKAKVYGKARNGREAVEIVKILKYKKEGGLRKYIPSDDYGDSLM